MAQLKDSVVQGSLRVTDTVYTTNENISSLTASKYVKTDANKNLITGDLPSGSTSTAGIVQLTDSYTSTDSSKATTGKAVAAALDALDATFTGATSKTLTALTQTNGKITTATFSDISIGAGAIGSGTLGVARGGTGIATASYKNAIIAGNDTTVTNAFQAIRTNNGAFYATAQDGAPTFGTLPVAQGGTNATSITKYGIVYGNASANGYTSTQGTAGYLLQGGGSSNTPSWIQATDSATASTIVKRDGNGNFVIKAFKGTSGTAGTYGDTLPTGTIETGRIFFQITDPYYEIPAGGTTGQALIKNSNTNRDVTWGSVGGIMRPDSSGTKFYLSGSSLTTENTNPALFSLGVFVENDKLFGTMWNDFAEYRETTEIIEPGRCIIENGDGTLSLSTERMQAGAEIVSDTFGFAIGETDKCRTPIAVSGRVLAYMHDRTHIKIGAPVCSGPNGTVSQMTEQEARDYPWLIIGTISAIPQEETWGDGRIQVKNRIWIRVR